MATQGDQVIALADKSLASICFDCAITGDSARPRCSDGAAAKPGRRA